jgi:RND family efflux transporter MFP subunit
MSFAQNITGEGYQLSQIYPEPYTQVIKRTGTIDFSRVVNLSFKTAGFLTRLNVDEGETFESKQLLAALDTEELVADKNATYAKLMQAKRDVNRIKALLAKKLSSQRELDDALTAVDTTRAAYRVAFYNLDKAQIFAPFDGVVLTRNTDLGELQSPGVSALKVATLSNNLIAKVALTGEEISLVHLHQEVNVGIDSRGIVKGRVSKIPAIADSKNHLFTIEIALTDVNFVRPLIAGQIAQVLIYAQSQDYVYRLPIEALNAVDEKGRALIAVERNNQPIQEAYTVYKIDNEYLYLQAANNASSLPVIVHGWNKLPLNPAEQ